MKPTDKEIIDNLSNLEKEYDSISADDSSDKIELIRIIDKFNAIVTDALESGILD